MLGYFYIYLKKTHSAGPGSNWRGGSSSISEMPAARKRAVKTETSIDKIETPKTIKRQKKTKELVSGKAKKLDLCITKQTPFPDFAHPTEEECREVHAALSWIHDDFMSARLAEREETPKALEGPGSKNRSQAAEDKDSCGSGERSVLDSLVGTILSQNTTDVNSARAFAALKQRFPTWEEVLALSP